MGVEDITRRRKTVPISSAQGAFPADLAAARRYADETLKAIDFSRRDIVLWVQGSGGHGMHPDFEDAVQKRWSERSGNSTLTYLRYTAGRDMRPSVATGVETLKLVLAGIAAMGGNHRVLLAGDSQGAWVLGEAIQDPMLRSVVDRAVMMGHPSLAANHFPASDPNVIEINKPDDPVATPVKGSADDAVDTYTALYTLQIWRLPLILKTLMLNPVHGKNLITSLVSLIPGLKGKIRNPHGYNEVMNQVAAFLDSGDKAAFVQAVEGTVLLGPIPGK